MAARAIMDEVKLDLESDVYQAALKEFILVEDKAMAVFSGKCSKNNYRNNLIKYR